MSLQDQLIAKGLATKKQGQRADRELKRRRKKKQGSRQRQSQARADKQAAREAHEAEVMERRRAVRVAERAARELHARRHELFQLIRANEVRSRGNIRFHFPTLDGVHLRWFAMSPRVATKLRAGEAAIAAFDHGARVEYTVVSRGAAARIDALDPRALVFWVRTDAPVDESEDFWVPTKDVCLRPRRATPADMARLVSDPSQTG